MYMCTRHTQIHTHARRGDTCTYTRAHNYPQKVLRAGFEMSLRCLRCSRSGTGPGPWHGNVVGPNPRDQREDTARLRRRPGGLSDPRDLRRHFLHFFGWFSAFARNTGWVRRRESGSQMGLFCPCVCVFVTYGISLVITGGGSDVPEGHTGKMTVFS